MTQNLLDADNQDQIVDPNKNYLEELVGENKKFKDVESLARGKYEADRMITFKNEEFDKLRDDYLKLREDYNSRAKLEELIDQLKQPQQQSHDETLNVNNQPQYGPKEIEGLVSSKLQEFEVNRKQEENFNLVRGKLQQRYGSNYKDAVKQQIEDLGITEAELSEMARRQPKVLIRTLGLDQEVSQERFQSPPRNQQRSDNFSPSLQKRTWSYYQKLRKDDPNLYWNPKTQLQLMTDKATLGKEFEDGDWDVIG